MFNTSEIVSHPVVWSDDDDLSLLDAIIENGIDNWSAISKILRRTPKDCAERYLQRFVTNPKEPELQELVKDWDEVRRNPKLCPFNCNVSVKNKKDTFNYAKFLEAEYAIQGVKRHHLRKGRTFSNKIFDLPEYNQLRSDFEVEYDNNAEKIVTPFEISSNYNKVNDENDSDKDLMDALKIASGEIYNFRLLRRTEIKKIVRNHGLIDRRKTFNMLQRLEVSNGGKNLSVLLMLMRFMSGPEFDYLLESIMYQNELKFKIQSYIHYRQQGIRFLSGIKNYEATNKMRIKYRAELKNNRVLIRPDGLSIKHRRTSAPLDLHNLPGYNLLDAKERELCSTARIIPETFYKFKELLIAECTRNNGLHLKQARQLVKIDVNKTRKIYDFLLDQKRIWVPS